MSPSDSLSLHNRRPLPGPRHHPHAPRASRTNLHPHGNQRHLPDPEPLRPIRSELRPIPLHRSIHGPQHQQSRPGRPAEVHRDRYAACEIRVRIWMEGVEVGGSGCGGFVGSWGVVFGVCGLALGLWDAWTCGWLCGVGFFG